MVDTVDGSDPYVLGLLRHAKSDYPAGVRDHERPLSERGRRDAAAIGPLVALRIGTLDLAVVSDAARAQETWNLSRVEASTQRDEARVYEAWANQLLDVVTGISGNVRTALMVGHNPGFEALAHHLAGEGSDPDALAKLSEKFPTCAFAVLESAVPFGEWGSATVRLRSFDIARGQPRG